MLFKRFSAVCAIALALGCFINAPAGATPQRSPFVFYIPQWSLPGGTLNCASGCRSTYNDDGSVEVDFGNGDSVLIMPDGTILGAP
ncbi:MAG TPA: hypothetical protein VGC72_13355 [Candidatus Elarobacter sp.]|jgi:hypothetical protein